MNSQTQRILIGVAILIVGGLGGLYFSMMNGGTTETPSNTNTITTPVASFDECVAAGYEVMETYPRQCKTSSGGVFIEYIGNELEKRDLIRITSLRPNDLVTSPLTIKGEARGTWYFEATFPITLTDPEGNVLAEHYAQAQGDWMTEEFVPFESTITFTVLPAKKTGFLILKKDNPSGLPEHDDELRIPVTFSRP